MVRAAVVGSLVTDLAFRVPRRPQGGEVIVATDFGTFLGGKGYNQALALARLGADVKVSAAVPDCDVLLLQGEITTAADVIVPNEVEARALVPGGKALNGPALPAALHQPGRTAVVTLGARGAAWHADSNHGFVAPPAITAVDATAAGDSRPWRCGSPRAPATRRRCGSPARPGHMRQGCLGLSRACPLAQTSRPC